MTPEWVERFMRYRAKYGPFNLAWRADIAIARAVSPFLKCKPSDVMLWPVEEPVEASAEEVFRMFQQLAPRKAK